MGIRLRVSNLGPSVNNLQLERIFAAQGGVESAQIVNETDEGVSIRRAYVQMSSDDEARSAMAALHGTLIDGVPLHIEATTIAGNEPVRRIYGNGRSGGGGVRSGRRH